MPILSIIVFLFLFGLVLLGSHGILYYSLVKFFAIENHTFKTGLLIIFFLLAISFILASLLAHFWENTFTKALYLVSSIWLGILTNLILTIAMCWFSVWLLKTTGQKPNTILLGSLFIGLALLFSLYGIWNAFTPEIKEISLRIKNLPAAWQHKKIIQLSDVHLGLIHDEQFLSKVIQQVNSMHPDMVVITGDLFDGMDGALDKLAAPLNNLVAPKGIYFVTGNHETYVGRDTALQALASTPVHVLQNKMIIIDGLQLVGLDYSAMGEQGDITTAMKHIPTFDPQKPSILLYHVPMHIDQAKAAGFNLMLSGHTHKGQMFPFGLITWLVYKGYDYGLHTEGDFSIYISSGVGTWGPPMRTGNNPEIVNITLE